MCCDLFIILPGLLKIGNFTTALPGVKTLMVFLVLFCVVVGPPADSAGGPDCSAG